MNRQFAKISSAKYLESKYNLQCLEGDIMMVNGSSSYDT